MLVAVGDIFGTLGVGVKVKPEFVEAEGAVGFENGDDMNEF